MLGGLHRHGAAGDEELELIGQEDDDQENGDNQGDGEDREDAEEAKKKQKKRILKFNDTQGEKTLEKLANLDLVKFDTELLVDPLFRMTTQKFDETSLGCLMSSRLNINSNLLLQLDSQMPVMANPMAEDSLKPSQSQHYA